MNLTPTDIKVLEGFRQKSKNDLKVLKNEANSKIKMFKSLRKSKDRDISINYYTKKIDLINKVLNEK